jgi:hypothetical protein
MECTCSISVDLDYCTEDNGFYKTKIIKARKIHICSECKREINPKERYEFISGVYDGVFTEYKTCMDCVSLKDSFFGSYYFTRIWEDFIENMDDCDWRVPEKCLAKLTPAARAKVCESIENYWNDGEDEE